MYMKFALEKAFLFLNTMYINAIIIVVIVLLEYLILSRLTVLMPL